MSFSLSFANLIIPSWNDFLSGLRVIPLPSTNSGKPHTLVVITGFPRIIVSRIAKGGSFQTNLVGKTTASELKILSKTNFLSKIPASILTRSKILLFLHLSTRIDLSFSMLVVLKRKSK